MGWRMHCFRLVWVKKLLEDRSIWVLGLSVIFAVMGVWGTQISDRLAFFPSPVMLEEEWENQPQTSLVISQVDLMLQYNNMVAAYIYIYIYTLARSSRYQFSYGSVVFSEGWNSLTPHPFGAWVNWSSSWSVFSSFHYHHFPRCLGYVWGRLAVAPGTAV